VSISQDIITVNLPVTRTFKNFFSQYFGAKVSKFLRRKQYVAGKARPSRIDRDRNRQTDRQTDRQMGLCSEWTV